MGKTKILCEQGSSKKSSHNSAQYKDFGEGESMAGLTVKTALLSLAVLALLVGAEAKGESSTCT